MKKIVTVLMLLVVYAGFAFAGETGRDFHFIAYDNGTVLDTQTNLMWASNDNNNGINWEDAKSYCENYRGGGYTDWRMPTQDELAGLYDRSIQRLKDGYYITKLINLTWCCPWASDRKKSKAAFFNFRSGARGWNYPSNDTISMYRALPVRSVKSEQDSKKSKE